MRPAGQRGFSEASSPPGKAGWGSALAANPGRHPCPFPPHATYVAQVFRLGRGGATGGSHRGGAVWRVFLQPPGFVDPVLWGGVGRADARRGGILREREKVVSLVSKGS